MPDVYEFYNLGIGDPHPISAASKLGIGDMLDAVMELFDLEKIEEEEDDRPKIAIVGKPNAGKSSLINNLLGENRVIVSDVAGTTRDAIDTEIVYNGTNMCLLILPDSDGRVKLRKILNATVLFAQLQQLSARMWSF